MSEENPIPKSEMLNSANSTKNNNKNKKGVEKMSVKESLIAMGLEEKTFGKYGAKRLFFSDGVDINTIVELCTTEEKFNEVKSLVMFGRKTADFIEAVKAKNPTFKIEVKAESKSGKRDGISKIVATVKKRFAFADSELLDNLKSLLSEIVASNKANKPKKISKRQYKTLDSMSDEEIFAYIESRKNKQN